MVIKHLKAINYRSLENIDISFNEFYNAISGKNNAGKSNIIKAILSLLTYDYRFYKEVNSNGINYSSDYPFWKKKDKGTIHIEIDVELDKDLDAGLFKFIKELIFNNEYEFSNQKEILKIIALQEAGQKDTKLVLQFGGIEVNDEYKRDELLNRIRSSNSILFHNSTENEPLYFSKFRRDSLMSYLNKDDTVSISKKREALEIQVKKSLKKHQNDFGSILGRMEDKYDVSLGISNLNLERQYVEISLKEKDIEVSLDDWGSGTKNKTLILLNLMNAKRIQSSSTVNDRLTPIIIIEEPESFLHPSAQSEFGRILQDLAAEFQIQIIVATHSPYLLSHKIPSANILLQRSLKSTKKGSIIIDTSGDNWYEPFSLSLGLNSSDLNLFKNTIFSNADEIILVEGKYDKEYFELLQDSRHGKNRLNFSGEIFQYDGAGSLKSTILLKFLKERFKKFLVTADLDQENELLKVFNSLSFEKDKHYIFIGKNESGKKSIEGLLPDSICSKVYYEEVDLVRKSTENSNDSKSAKNMLKSKLLDRFKAEAFDDISNFNEFHKLTRKINKIFK